MYVCTYAILAHHHSQRRFVLPSRGQERGRKAASRSSLLLLAQALCLLGPPSKVVVEMWVSAFHTDCQAGWMRDGKREGNERGKKEHRHEPFVSLFGTRICTCFGSRLKLRLKLKLKLKLSLSLSPCLRLRLSLSPCLSLLRVYSETETETETLGNGRGPNVYSYSNPSIPPIAPSRCCPRPDLFLFPFLFRLVLAGILCRPTYSTAQWAERARPQAPGQPEPG